LELAAQPPAAMREIMSIIIKGADVSQEESLRMERQAVLNTLGNTESQEGMMALWRSANLCLNKTEASREQNREIIAT